MRDDFASKGMPLAKAKKKAARIFNATRKPNESPVTGNYEASKKKRFHRMVNRGLKRAFPGE